MKSSAKQKTLQATPAEQKPHYIAPKVTLLNQPNVNGGTATQLFEDTGGVAES